MSDQSINDSRTSLKELNARLKKLTNVINRLDILAHQQKRLAKYYRELSFQCTQLAQNMDHMDELAFELRQEVDNLLNKQNT